MGSVAVAVPLDLPARLFDRPFLGEAGDLGGLPGHDHAEVERQAEQQQKDDREEGDVGVADAHQVGGEFEQPREGGTGVFRFFLTLATRQRFTDTTSGMRAANRRVMSLFSENYSPDFAEIESLQLAVRQGLRVEEVPVRMLERAGGSSFLTPLRSAFFIFKGLVVLLVGMFRPRQVEVER